MSKGKSYDTLIDERSGVTTKEYGNPFTFAQILHDSQDMLHGFPVLSVPSVSPSKQKVCQKFHCVWFPSIIIVILILCKP